MPLNLYQNTRRHIRLDLTLRIHHCRNVRRPCHKNLILFNYVEEGKAVSLIEAIACKTLATIRGVSSRVQFSSEHFSLL